MATNGMTINGLNPLSALTADDKIPVWDTGASGEPTKEITAQNMANSVKSLASLPNTTEMNAAIAQSTAWVYVGQATGDTILSFPATAAEVSGYLVFGENKAYGFPFFCVRNTDIAVYPNKLLFTFYDDINDRHEVVVSVNWDTNQIHLVTWKYNETDYMSASAIKLFYK